MVKHKVANNNSSRYNLNKLGGDSVGHAKQIKSSPVRITRNIDVRTVIRSDVLGIVSYDRLRGTRLMFPTNQINWFCEG